MVPGSSSPFADEAAASACFGAAALVEDFDEDEEVCAPAGKPTPSAIPTIVIPSGRKPFALQKVFRSREPALSNRTEGGRRIGILRFRLIEKNRTPLSVPRLRLDPDRRAHKPESLPNLVFKKSLEREMQL